MSDSLGSHGLQHSKLPCPSLFPRVCSNSCPLNQWCHPTISSSVIPFFSCLQSFLASGPFPMSQFFASDGQSTGPFSFSIRPLNEYSGLISFRIDWFNLAVHGLSRVFSSTTVESVNSFVLRLLYGPTLTSVHDYWKNHNFEYVDLCQQSDVSACNMLSRFVIAFLPRSKCLLISLVAFTVCSDFGAQENKISFSPSIYHEVLGPNAWILVLWMLSFKPVFFFILLFHPYQETL